jgi:hypothetical protein
LKVLNYWLFVIVISAAVVFFAGCGIEEPIERVTIESKPRTSELPQAYNSIHIKQSTSAEVLETIKRYAPELVSQSESVVASWGEKKKTSQLWLTMAAFDEEDFALTRKYFLAVDEKPWHLGAKGQKLRFDSEMVLDEATLSEPYANENEKRIAIVTKILNNTRDDIMQVRQDSKVLDAGAMMINQTMERVVYILKASPALAARLDEPNGLDFDHLTLGTSRIGMAVDDNVARIKIRIGSVKRLWKEE